MDGFNKIFLDIKAPLSDEGQYDTLVHASGVAKRVKETIDVCLTANIDLELVTTVFKHLVCAEDVVVIAREIESFGAAHCPYVLQQGRIELVPNNVLKEEDMFTHEELKELATQVYRAAHLSDVRIRTRDYGEEVIYRGC